MGKKSLFVLVSIISLLAISFVSAAPDIQIMSPQNMTYDTTKISVEVTSNETVDFYFRDARGKEVVLAQNVTSLDSFIYVRDGNYDFEIWANNTAGTTNKAVSFTNTQHNPISITDCGFIYSSDTQYVLANDIVSSSSFTCLHISNVRNITLDLAGYSITAARNRFFRALTMYYVSDAEVFNGHINSNADEQTMYAAEFDLSKTKFHNLTFNGFFGLSVFSLEDVAFEDVTINASIGMWHLGLSNVHFINSKFIWNGITSTRPDCPSAAFCDWSDHSELFLENTTISGFPDQEFQLRGAFSDIYLRNSDIDINKINYPDWTSDARIFDQHLILVNVTDQLNETGSGIIEILDDATFERKTGLDLLFEPLSNPTGDVLIATEEDGTADVWLTEKLTHARSSSPAVIEEYDFSTYNLTARSWESQASAELNLTGVNSIIPVSMNIVVPRALPPCTIEQALDINNDGEISPQDAVIILKKMAGKEVEITGTKNCTGISAELV